MANELTVFEQLEQEAREGYLAREMPFLVARIRAQLPERFKDCTNHDVLRKMDGKIEDIVRRMKSAEQIQQNEEEENRRRSKFNLLPLHVYDQSDFDHDNEMLGHLKELRLFIDKNGLGYKLQMSFWEGFKFSFCTNGYLYDWDRLYQAFAEQKAREIVLAKCATWSPRQFILEFQRKRIEDTRDAAIGAESALIKEQVATVVFLERLRSVESRIRSMIELDPVNDIFLHILREVQTKISVTLPAYQKMVAVEEEATIFVNKELAKIACLEDLLQRLEIIREARALCDRTDEVLSNAEMAILNSLITLATGFKEMHEKIARVYEEAGIALAVDASGQNETFSMGVLDRLIDQHVPAKLEVVEKVS